MKDKAPMFSVRLSPDLDQRLDHIAEKLDLSKVTIARQAIRAAVEAIEANGFRIEIPLKMEVKKGADAPAASDRPTSSRSARPRVTYPEASETSDPEILLSERRKK